MTRRTVRRAVIYCGLGIGAAGLVLVLFSFFGEIQRLGPYSDARVGRGGIAVTWFGQTRTRSVATSPSSFQVLPALTEWRVTRPLAHAPWYLIPAVPGEPPTPVRDARLVIPWWLMLLIGAVSAYALLPEDVAAGHCRKCGFDLRDTPAAPGAAGLVRCPECGTSSRVARPAADPAARV
jgi:hypothetical protein